MKKPARRILLPGVSNDGVPPPVVLDSRFIVTRARRRAAVRDVLNLMLLVSVDGLFLRFPQAHIPLCGRGDSLFVLLGLNVILTAYFWSVRWLPRWTARRVATTWCVAEQARFVRSSER